MVEALKSHWFVVLIAIMILSFVCFFIYDENKYNVSGKKADGEELLASVAGKNITADGFFETEKRFDSTLLFQMYKNAVIDQSIDTTKELKSNAKEIESAIRANFKNQFGDNYETELATELANYGFIGDNACYEFSLISSKEKLLNTDYITNNFDQYKEAVEKKNPRTISILYVSVVDPQNLTEDEQKKLDNIESEIKSESFGKAATEFSEDVATASNEGFYGYSDSSDTTNTSYYYYGTGLPVEVASASQELKEGETSDWVTVQNQTGSYFMYKVYVNSTDLKAMFESSNEDVKDQVINAFLKANTSLEMEALQEKAATLDIKFENEEVQAKIEKYIQSELEGDE